MSRALGRYELLRPLARGGMAEVYLARRRAAGVEKWLVVKRIRAERANDVQFLDLFQREAKLSMSLAHQNIVPVFDFGRIDDQVFLAMERVEGRDLGSSLAKAKGDPPIPPLVAAFITSECCQALDYAHRRKSPEGTPLGIVHRDVTPRNVLLSWSGEVKLTDFGIAALAGESTAQLLGTPAYMAPEQARKEPVDARADLYAVGLVLREMLTGARVRTATDRDVLVAHARTGELPPWPTDLELDARLVAIADRATAHAVDNRYPDAREMLAALDDFIVTERAEHKGASPARRVSSWLDAVWGTERERERDDVGPSGDLVPPQHLMSFLDDGGFDVVGTGTQRSMLATAADDDDGAGAGTLSTAAPTLRAKHGSIPPLLSSPVEVVQPGSSVIVDDVPPVTKSARSRGLLIALVALAVIGVVVVRFTATTATQPAAAAVDAALADAVPPDAVPSDAAPPDAEPSASVDAAILPVAIDAGRTQPPRADAGGPRRRVDAAVATARPDAAIRTRNVSINFKPWAYFTIDGDTEQFQTVKTVKLAPGRHVIHFSNPVIGVTKDVPIDVPADRDITVVESAK